MPRGQVVYRFGGFELDPQHARLLRAGQPVPLSAAQLPILIHLVVHAPAIVNRDAIAHVGWGGAASANSIEKAVCRIRQVLGDTTGKTFVETIPNRGYRFVAAIEEVYAAIAPAPDALDDQPIRALVVGDRELTTLSRQAIGNARREFERAVAAAPEYAPAHVGLAMAGALIFDGSRFEITCDLDALSAAVEHARIGVTLAPQWADAWSTQGFVLYLNGEPEKAVIAARKGVALEPGSWRHALRLAYVSWGEARMEAAHLALVLRPLLALAYWLRATVLIARGAFEAALMELRAGCAAQDGQAVEAPVYPAVGLHLLRGLILAAQGLYNEATAAFEAELAASNHGQVYARECLANTWYAIGAVRLRQRHFDGATQAFRRALDVLPAHLCSLATLGQDIPSIGTHEPRVTDAAIARAIALARGNRHAEAAKVYADAIAASRMPNAGWMLPVEPILCPTSRPDMWRHVLTLVQERAT